MNRPAFWQLMRESIDLRQWIAEAGVETVVRVSASIERYVFVTAYIMR